VSNDAPLAKRPPPCRPYHLTPDQLRRAYQQAPMNERLARCMRTRLEMLREQQKREAASEEYVDATC